MPRHRVVATVGAPGVRLWLVGLAVDVVTRCRSTDLCCGRMAAVLQVETGDLLVAESAVLDGIHGVRSHLGYARFTDFGTPAVGLAFSGETGQRETELEHGELITAIDGCRSPPARATARCATARATRFRRRDCCGAGRVPASSGTLASAGSPTPLVDQGRGEGGRDLIGWRMAGGGPDRLGDGGRGRTQTTGFPPRSGSGCAPTGPWSWTAAGADLGTGTYAVLAHVVADALGVPSSKPGNRAVIGFPTSLPPLGSNEPSLGTAVADGRRSHLCHTRRSFTAQAG